MKRRGIPLIPWLVATLVALLAPWPSPLPAPTPAEAQIGGAALPDTTRLMFKVFKIPKGQRELVSYSHEDTSSCDSCTAKDQRVRRYFKADSTLIVPVFSSAPSVSILRKGDIYYNSADTTFYTCTGRSWRGGLSLATAASANVLTLLGSANNAAIRSNIGNFSALDASDGNPTNAVSVDANGYVTMPNQVSFSAYMESHTNDCTGDGTVVTVPLETERWDTGDNFNTSTHTFTAPVTARYVLCAKLRFLGTGAGHTSVFAQTVTSNCTYYGVYIPTVGAAAGVNNYPAWAVVADMDANDTAYVTFEVDGSTKTVDLYGASSSQSFCAFMGFLAQ